MLNATDSGLVDLGLSVNAGEYISRMKRLGHEAAFASNYFNDMYHLRSFCEFLIARGTHWGDMYIANVMPNHDGPGEDYADTLLVYFDGPGLSAIALNEILNAYQIDEVDPVTYPDGRIFWRFWWD